MLRKRYFTLLELLIALVLLSGLMSALSTMIYYQLKVTQVTVVKNKELFKRAYTQGRLYEALSKLLPPEASYDVFYTDNSDLIFTYEPPPQSDPIFADEVEGRYILDGTTLVWEVRPSPRLWPTETTVLRETLMEGVQSLTWTFMDDAGTETNFWPTGANAIPAQMKLSVALDGYTNPFVMAFIFYQTVPVHELP